MYSKPITTDQYLREQIKKGLDVLKTLSQILDQSSVTGYFTIYRRDKLI